MAMELEIRIPENWQDVRLEHYLKYYRAIKPYQELEEFNAKLIELAFFHLCGVEKGVLDKMSMEDFKTVSTVLLDLLNSGKKQELVKSFQLGDTKYGFITDIDSMTYGEYVDLVTYSKDVYENAALMCSILYRPIVEENKGEYKIAEYKGTNENQIQLFYQKLTMDIVFGALSFFLHLQTDLLNSTLTYTTEIVKRIAETPDSTVAQILEQNGVSMQQLQQLQEMMSQSLTKSQD